MAEAPIRRARVAGYDMAYLEAGAGEPLVFIHGALCDARYWTPQIAHFAATRRALAPSLRHCWPDRWDGRDDYTASRHIADIIAFIETFGGPVDLVGHSRGGRLALHVAAGAPHLVRRLALYQPGGAWDATFLPAQSAPAPQPNAPASLIAAGETEAGVEKFLDGLMGAGYWTHARAELKQMLRDNATTLIAMGRDSSAAMTSAMAQSIVAPTLLIGGAQIPQVFVRVLDRLEELVKNARRARFDSHSHFANLEAPGMFNAVLEAFLGPAA